MKNTDKYELYSFSIYLYLYGFFYLFIFEQTLIKGLLINILTNIFSFYIFKYNFISFLRHKYWRENLTDIAMPQLINCATNITIYSTLNISYNYNILILSFTDILTYLLIKNMYKNEINYSKNLRFIINILFFILFLL